MTEVIEDYWLVKNSKSPNKKYPTKEDALKYCKKQGVPTEDNTEFVLEHHVTTNETESVAPFKPIAEKQYPYESIKDTIDIIREKLFENKNIHWYVDIDDGILDNDICIKTIDMGIEKEGLKKYEGWGPNRTDAYYPNKYFSQSSIPEPKLRELVKLFTSKEFLDYYNISLQEVFTNYTPCNNVCLECIPKKEWTYPDGWDEDKRYNDYEGYIKQNDILSLEHVHFYLQVRDSDIVISHSNYSGRNVDIYAWYYITPEDFIEKAMKNISKWKKHTD